MSLSRIPSNEELVDELRRRGVIVQTVTESMIGDAITSIDPLSALHDDKIVDLIGKFVQNNSVYIHHRLAEYAKTLISDIVIQDPACKVAAIEAAAMRAAVKEIVTDLTARGKSAEDLDDLVHDLYDDIGASMANQAPKSEASDILNKWSYAASDINREGLEAQVLELVRHYGIDEARAKISGSTPNP